jgi:hypothetical protein
LDSTPSPEHDDADTVSVEDRLARWPELKALFSIRWFAEQAQLPAESRSPLYSWLGGVDQRESTEFCANLVRALASLAGRPGTRDRLNRLKGQWAEFWSALCELLLAGALIECGTPVSLRPDTPDLVATTEAGTVGIELTAGFPTLRFTQLHSALTDAWAKPGRLILVCPNETDVFLTTERDALVRRLQAIDLTTLAPPVVNEEDRLSDGDYMHGGISLSPEDRQIPVADLIEPERLQVFVGPAPYPVVVVRSGARFGYVSPWPKIVEAAHAKDLKLSSASPSIIAFEVGHMHTTTRIWADLAARGAFSVELTLRSSVAGVLLYWQDARAMRPVWPLFVWNPDFSFNHAPVDELLEAFGAKAIHAIAESPS